MPNRTITMSRAKTKNQGRRVVITGLGVIASNGIGKDAFWKALKEGKSGIKKVTRFDVTTYTSHLAGEVHDFDPMDYMSPKNAKRMDIFAQFAVAASKMAIEDSGLTISHKNNGSTGIVFSSAIGGGFCRVAIRHSTGARTPKNEPLLGYNSFSWGRIQPNCYRIGRNRVQ